MKFFFDANLSPHLANAVGALCKPHNVEVLHKFERFPRNTPDVEWIDALAVEGDWAIVSHDRFLSNPLERDALRRHGLTVFILKKAWSAQRNWEKSAQLIRWWPRIMEQTSLVTGGAAFLVPYRLSGKGQFETLKF